MGCYYCDQAMLDKQEIGICKECYTAACGPNVGAHGEKCTLCAAFFCHEHQSEHAIKGHQADSLKVFPQTARGEIKLVLNWLKNPESEPASLAIDHGIQLSKKFNDHEMENMFRNLLVKNTSDGKATAALDQGIATPDKRLVDDLRNLLLSKAKDSQIPIPDS
jgi:hypothetical protein